MSDKVLRKRDVQEITGLSDMTIYRLEKAGKFPKRFIVTGVVVGWLASEIQEWVRARAESREAA